MSRPFTSLADAIERARRYARRFYARGLDADDMAQEAAALAIEHYPRLQGPRGPVILYNLVRTRARNLRRARDREEIREMARAREPITRDTPLTLLSRRETLEALRARLPAQEWEVVYRTYWEAQAEASIASDLSTTVGVVRTTLASGLARIREILAGDPDLAGNLLG